MSATETLESADAGAHPPAEETTDPYPEPRRSRRFDVALASVGVVALAVRLMNVFWWRPTTDRPGYHGYRLGGDAYYYHWQANAMAKGAWFVDPFVWLKQHGLQQPSAAHPPIYTLYLSIWSRFGFDTVTWHRVASSLVGVAAVIMIGVAARRIGGSAAGIVAASLAAVYPEMWINDGMLLSEPVAILMAAVALYAMYGFARRPTVRNAVWMGLACGITALTRTELLILIPVAVIPLSLLARELSWRQRALRGLLACTIAGFVLLPWSVYNYTRFVEPTTITTGTGAALSASACDETFYGRWIGYYANCFNGPWPAASLDESQRDVVPREQAITYLENHERRLPFVVFARIGRLWGFYKPGDTTFLDWWLEGRGRAPSWIGLFSYYALVPFALGGLVLLHRRRITILPLLAFVVASTFAATITFGVTRYRAPAEVSIVIAAAVALCAGWRFLAMRVGRRSRGGTGTDDEDSAPVSTYLP